MLKIAYNPIYKLHLPKGHRFPMEKYELLPQQLIREGTCEPENFFEPHYSEDYVNLVHEVEYVTALKNLSIPPREARKIGFPMNKGLVEREFTITNGTIQACDFALKYGIAMNVAGGTHHAYTNRGEGFCMLNDQAIGARYLQETGKTKQILIVDLDVHQGNGTAQIFQDDDSVFTFSMHGKSNYPFKKEVSDLDIPLETGTRDEDYLSILKETLPKLISVVKPDFIFYLSGVDILESDKLGKLSVSMAGCKERDRFVLQTCKDHNIPVEVSMGGGYTPNLKVIIEAHANTFRLAQDIYSE